MSANGIGCEKKNNRQLGNILELYDWGLYVNGIMCSPLVVLW